MSSEIAIKVDDLSKCYHIYEKPRDRLMQMLVRGRRQYYREFWAVKGVSFEIKKGETVGIVGRNGSGKSTLLQMICGTLNPTGGSVQANGRIAALLELGSGFNPEFTGRENVYLNGAVLGLSREEIDARFGDIAAFADIGDFIERPVKSYSSGMYVRLAFAVQAMIDPDILIVDEALAVGDEKFQRKCFARLEELKSNGSSILFVSHSSSSIIELCDKTLLLDHGTRLMFASATETIRAYQKLIYAPVEAQECIIQELLAKDISKTKKVAQYSSNHTINDTPDAVYETDLKSVFEEEAVDSFDPGLIPETTTVYPTQGAVIDSIQIVNLRGEIVNVLQSGVEYIFLVSFRLLENFSGIFVGLHLKSISGVVITGQRHPEEGRYIEDVKERQKIKVKFSFRMDLLPGVYFAGAGIWSNKEPACAHRIIDALMFRVTPARSVKSFGYADLMSAEPVMELEGTSNDY